ncbi:thiamine pyrophosphate-binding protein [Lentibacillus sp. N15]|uniref:thiamine pyrophosphate-binding protein n=1 Tax=Lentibacillus songyuanensis TaxID=3136161 RepID=UPI0031BAAD0C
MAHSDKIHFVNVRHEQGAAFMADVYGRLSEKAGVCLATLGRGASIGEADLLIVIGFDFVEKLPNVE